MRKSKPPIGRKEPFLCQFHPKRLATTKRNRVGQYKTFDVCWYCYFEDVLLTTSDPYDRELVQNKIKRWDKWYGDKGQ